MHAPASRVHEASSGGPPGGPMGGPPAPPSVPPATGLGYRQHSHPVRGQATHFEEAQEVAQALRGLSLPDDTVGPSHKRPCLLALDPTPVKSAWVHWEEQQWAAHRLPCMPVATLSVRHTRRCCCPASLTAQTSLFACGRCAGHSCTRRHASLSPRRCHPGCWHEAAELPERPSSSSLTRGNDTPSLRCPVHSQMRFRPPLPPQAPPAVPHHMLQAAHQDRPLPQMGLPRWAPLSRSELGHSSSLVPGLRAHTFPAAAAPLQAPGSSLDLGNPQVGMP